MQSNQNMVDKIPVICMTCALPHYQT